MIAEEKLCANSSMKISPDLAGKKKNSEKGHKMLI
jgi:hypothetical protein